MDAGLPHLTLEHIEHTFTLVERNGRRREYDSVFRHQLHFFRVQPVDVVQNSIAADRERTGMGHIGELYILRLHRQGLSFRHWIRKILVLSSLRIDLHAVGL